MRRAAPLVLSLLLGADVVFAAVSGGAQPFGESYTELFRRPFYASAALSIRRPAWNRKLLLAVYYRDPARSVARVSGSAREMGTVILRRNGHVHLFFPRADLLLTLASSVGSFPLFGSDFSSADLLAFGDVSSQYTARSDGEETLSGVPALRYRLKPRAPAGSPYAEIRLWVTRDGGLPLRQEFLSAQGEIAREIVMESDGRLPFPARWKARNFGPRGGESELLFRMFERNHPARDELFTVEGLRQWR